MTFQLGANILDACVLAIVKEKDTYGYELTQSVKSIVDISESTLYPVLRRLLKDGLLSTYDRPISGRNRRYYQITVKGKEKLQFYCAEWEDYKNKIDGILKRGESNE